MRRLFVTLLVLFPTLVLAQPDRRGPGSNWSDFPGLKECIGGTQCAERRLRVPLEDRPVLAIRFHAHDDIGARADGALRVKIDGNTVRSRLDVPRRGEMFTLEVDELRGRYLVFEPANSDEVEISNISVLYGRESTGRIPRGRPPANSGGWRPYPHAGMCIGGDECRKNGTRIMIALQNAPVLGVRFSAHDNFGMRADGKLNVRIDDITIASWIDVRREGRRHDLEVENLVGNRLVIEAASNDEVQVSDIEILYGRPQRDHRLPREITHQGGCIGGDECGGRRASIRIPIHGRSIASIRFYARDDIGTRASGELRIRVDDEILEYGLDIPREGRTFTIDGRLAYGSHLVFEPAANDEVEIKDIRIRFEDD